MWTPKLTTYIGSTIFEPETKMSQNFKTLSKVDRNHPLANLWYPTNSPTTNSILPSSSSPSRMKKGTKNQHPKHPWPQDISRHDIKDMAWHISLASVIQKQDKPKAWHQKPGMISFTPPSVI